MTVIAWDGETLAADKQSTNAGMRRAVTKVRRINGSLCAFAGDAAFGMEMLAWLEQGAKPGELPSCQRSDDWVSVLVITPEKRILKYERSAYPIDFSESKFFAMGAGRDFAMAAMHLGCDATKAVEVASVFECSCGMGCDALRFD